MSKQEGHVSGLVALLLETRSGEASFLSVETSGSGLGPSAPALRPAAARPPRRGRSGAASARLPPPRPSPRGHRLHGASVPCNVFTPEAIKGKVFPLAKLPSTPPKKISTGVDQYGVNVRRFAWACLPRGGGMGLPNAAEVHGRHPSLKNQKVGGKKKKKTTITVYWKYAPFRPGNFSKWREMSIVFLLAPVFKNSRDALKTRQIRSWGQGEVKSDGRTFWRQGPVCSCRYESE